MREWHTFWDSDILRNSKATTEVIKEIKSKVIWNTWLITASGDLENTLEATSMKILENIQCQDLGRARTLWMREIGPYNILKKIFHDYPHLQTIIFIGTLKSAIKEIYRAYKTASWQNTRQETNLDSPIGYEILDNNVLSSTEFLCFLNQLAQEETDQKKRTDAEAARICDNYFDI